MNWVQCAMCTLGSEETEMTFKQWLQVLNGLYVLVYVKNLSDVPRDDGAKWCLHGVLTIQKDFVLIQADEETPPAAVRIKDIIMIEQDVDVACECDNCEEDDESADKKDLEKKLWEWERSKGRLGS